MKKLTALLVALIIALSSVAAFASFNDISTDTLAWAGDAINRLVGLDVINGYTDGTFKPNNNVTRAEFAKMIAVAFELKGANANYDDISQSWANEYICALGGAMYSSGASFEPDKDATRADIAYCVASVLSLEVADKSHIKTFSDHGDILVAMFNKVAAAAENKIIVGYQDGTLRPNAPVTRAEAAVIICRALDLLNNPSQNPQLPPVTEEEVKPADDKELSNLYPGKDLIFVVSVNKTIDSKNGEDAYKITYKLSGDTTEYSSVVPYDTAVTGIKNDISYLASGDVMIMDTAFLGYIGSLHVLASFGGGSFNFNPEIAGYGKGDYVLAGGKIKSIVYHSKNAEITLEVNGTEKIVYVPKGMDTVTYSSWKKGDKWSVGYIGDVDPETETEYAYIRFTDGVATDIIFSDFVR